LTFHFAIPYEMEVICFVHFVKLEWTKTSVQNGNGIFQDKFYSCRSWCWLISMVKLVYF